MDIFEFSSKYDEPYTIQIYKMNYNKWKKIYLMSLKLYTSLNESTPYSILHLHIKTILIDS